MPPEVLYATTNPGKLWEIGKHLKPQGIELLSLADVNITVDIPETGVSLEENAKLKVKTIQSLIPQMLIIADDTGLEIDALKAEPGIHVRRWKDGINRMEDQEIIDYCLEQLNGVPLGARGAQFRSVVALAVPGSEEVEYFEGILRGIILEKASDLRFQGFPFESLFFVPQWQLLLGEVHQLPQEKKDTYLSHREKAVQKAVPRIKAIVS